MSIERTELANQEFRATVGSLTAAQAAALNPDGVDMLNLGAAFFRAVSNGETADIETIKRYMRSKQTWRSEQ